MNFWRICRWIGRGGTSVPLVGLLLEAGLFAHWVAVGAASKLADPPPELEARIVRSLAVVRFIQLHPWITLPYVALFVGSLLWLQWRHAPRWSVWATWTVWAVPCVQYAWACLRLGLHGF